MFLVNIGLIPLMNLSFSDLKFLINAILFHSLLAFVWIMSNDRRKLILKTVFYRKVQTLKHGEICVCFYKVRRKDCIPAFQLQELLGHLIGCLQTQDSSQDLEAQKTALQLPRIYQD